MPPIPLPADPLLQYLLAFGLAFLGQVLHAKGVKFPLLSALLSLLGGSGPAPTLPPSSPATPAPSLAAMIPDIPGTQIDDLARRLVEGMQKHLAKPAV